MGTDDIMDMLLLIFVIAILTPILITNTIPLFKGEIGGFDTLIEKTAQRTSGELKPKERELYREDILLMALIADEKAPKPGVYQAAVNGVSSEITVDELINQRVNMLQELNAHLVDNIELKIETYIGYSGMRKWVVLSK